MWKNLTGLHKNQTWTLIKFVEINWNGNFDWATSPKISVWPACVWMGSNPFMYSTSSRKLGMTLCNHKAHTMLKKWLTADVFFVLKPCWPVTHSVYWHCSHDEMNHTHGEWEMKGGSISLWDTLYCTKHTQNKTAPYKCKGQGNGTS